MKCKLLKTGGTLLFLNYKTFCVFNALVLLCPYLYIVPRYIIKMLYLEKLK